MTRSNLDAYNWCDLETRGFLVVPSFLNDDDISTLVAAYDTAPRDASLNYLLKYVPRPLLNQLAPRFAEVAERVREHSSTNVRLLSEGFYFNAKPEPRTPDAKGTKGEQVLPWHQDGESWWVYQNHIDHLNFWVPIIKPSRTASNLSVLPWDRLAAASPTAEKQLRGRGAHAFVRRDGQTVIIDANVDDGQGTAYDFDIDAIGETPEVGVGDLVLLRGDVVHRTQDASTERISVSFRMIDPQGITRRSLLAAGGWMKYTAMIKNITLYQSIVDCYYQAGSDEVSCAAMVDYVYAHRGDETGPGSVPRFLSKLTRGWS
jgi:hypothetical protein